MKISSCGSWSAFCIMSKLVVKTFFDDLDCELERFQHALLTILVNLCVADGGVSVEKLSNLINSNVHYFKYQIFELFTKGIHVGKSTQEIRHEIQTRLNLTERKMRNHDPESILI